MEDFYVKILTKNVKIAPLNAYERLTAVSLAFWIPPEDDGSFNKAKENLILCTDSFSKEDVLRLISILRDKFNLSCGLINIGDNKAGQPSYRIRINKSSMATLIVLVKPYMINSMLYKWGL